MRYNHRSRLRLGVASTHLGERLPEQTKVKIYLQKAHGFGLPADLSKDVIMCGPGTGIAPFRAFLRERAAAGAPAATGCSTAISVRRPTSSTRTS